MQGNLPCYDDAFHPLQANGDTEEEDIGLVKHYLLDANTQMYARYEVARQVLPYVNTADSNYNPHAVHDITTRRVPNGAPGSGTIWSLESVGYVYHLRDSGKKFNESPNEIFGRARVTTEIQRMSLTLSTKGAVAMNRLGDLTMSSNNAWIRGNSDWGAVCAIDKNPPYNFPFSKVTGLGGPPSSIVDPMALSIPSIFGTDKTNLSHLADYAVSKLSDLPAVYPSMALVYVDVTAGPATFDSSRPLQGGGVLFVNGDFVAGDPTTPANTLFSGLIYVDGNATVYAPADISGHLVVTGKLSVQGSGDVAQIQFDQSILDSVLHEIGQYRENKWSNYVKKN